jgi:hypothetical protein
VTPSALDPKQLQLLLDMVNLGYYRGILNQLEAMTAAQPDQAAFFNQMRELAREFQFEVMRDRLNPLSSPPDPARQPN